ncbi:hypothetical protein TIFTF001_020287 [Ficus carica]|uniref:Uncharacterized protein n=1 Tax=Ficus carica TaxID=3494 RepID=A0AA88AAH1_FICCA|nr:hypothetical protein TIFTF001_020287 [Ficus carica]
METSDMRKRQRQRNTPPRTFPVNEFRELATAGGDWVEGRSSGLFRPLMCSAQTCESVD